MQSQMIVGSIAQMATQSNKSIAETFIGCDACIIVDVSGSMSANDSRGGKSRYDVALQELSQLQQKMPGKIAAIAFSSTVQFIPGGIPPFLSGGTNLAGALKFARVADVPGVRFVVISDGEPDSESDALDEARKYKNRIDTVFVGNEDDQAARNFLKRLAEASGGTTVQAARVLELADKVTLLLGA